MIKQGFEKELAPLENGIFFVHPEFRLTFLIPITGAPLKTAKLSIFYISMMI
jgi:hypothetical protein